MHSRLTIQELKAQEREQALFYDYHYWDAYDEEMWYQSGADYYEDFQDLIEDFYYLDGYYDDLLN